ncbi:SDR family oxidoreductase [Rhizobium sp. GCM10022189]|uniref:SDR family oxidoreductase n=1 Tax=Rhizobium sp. GCM10022189 TaxID=3252654 RepID=UPI00360ACD24
MKITVVGASGIMGSKIVRELERAGQTVNGVSTSTGVDAYSGDGVQAALAEADVVIDVTNSGSFGDSNALDFFKQAGKNLLAAAKHAGVGHYLALSVVATDRLVENDYFRAKMVQENLIRASGLPYTIVRSAQFFEFFDGIINLAGDGNDLRLSPSLVRPISADEASTLIARIMVGAPRNDIVEIAGPEAIQLDQLAREILTATEDPRSIAIDPDAPFFGVELARTTLLPGTNAVAGTVTFHDWLSRSMMAA